MNIALHPLMIITLPGESVDDCGGGYSESVAEMCDELMNGSLPLLIPTPNGRDEAGTSRDCFLLNPQSNSSHHMNMFTFLGRLLCVVQIYLYRSVLLLRLGFESIYCVLLKRY